MKWTTRNAVISLVLSAGVLASSVLAQTPPPTTTTAAPAAAATGQNINTQTPTGTTAPQVLPLSMGITTPAGDVSNAEELRFDDNGDGTPDRTVNADIQMPEDVDGAKATEASDGFASPGSNPGYQATWTTSNTADPNKPSPNLTSSGGPIADSDFKDPGGYQIGNHSVSSKTPPPAINDPPPEVTTNTPETTPDPNAPQDPNNPPVYEGQSNIYVHDNTSPRQEISMTVLDDETADGKTSTEAIANTITVLEKPENAAIVQGDPAGVSGKTLEATVLGANFKPAQSETAMVMGIFGDYNLQTGQVTPKVLNQNTLPYPANNTVINVQNEFEFKKNQRVRVEFSAKDNWAAAKDVKVSIEARLVPEEGGADRATFEKDPSGAAGVLTIRDKDTKVKLVFTAKDVATHPAGTPNATYTTVTFYVKDSEMIVDQVGGESEGSSETTGTAPRTDGGGTD